MRILVVEDEPRLLRNIAKILREEGYAVDSAEDGEEGLYKAQNWEYDAVVLDLMLPERASNGRRRGDCNRRQLAPRPGARAAALGLSAAQRFVRLFRCARRPDQNRPDGHERQRPGILVWVLKR